MAVVLGGRLGRGLVELAHMAAALRILPQHHDAVIVDPTSARLGRAVLIAQPQHHAVLGCHCIVRCDVAALGHDAAINVVLLGLAQSRCLGSIGHPRRARRLAQAIQHRIHRSCIRCGHAPVPAQALKLGGRTRRDIAIQRFLHHCALAVVQGLEAGGGSTRIVPPQQGDDLVGCGIDIHFGHGRSLNMVGTGSAYPNRTVWGL